MRDNLDIPASADGSFRVSRQRGGDPNTRRMAIVAGAIGGSLLLLVGAWSLTGARRSGVPVLEADARPLRVKPEKAGGLDVDGKDEAIMGGGAGAKAALAPASEAPAPQTLKAQATAAQAPKPVPVQQAADAGSPAVSPLPDTRPPEPKAAEVKPADAKPVVKATPARTGNAQVQLAALVSEQAAMAEWQRLEKKMPDVLGGYRPAVLKVERDGKTLYRLRTGGFADAGQATSFCDKVKAKGGVCSVASF